MARVKWSNGTTKDLEGVKWDVVRELSYGLTRRAKIKEDEDRIKEEKDEINTRMRPFFDLAGIRKISAEGIGTMYIQDNMRPIFSRDKAIEYLINKGVPASLVAEAFDAATAVREYESLVFRRQW